MSNQLQEFVRIRSEFNDLRATQLARGQSMPVSNNNSVASAASAQIIQQNNQKANLARINNDLRALRGSALVRNDNASLIVDTMASQLMNQVSAINQ